MKIRFKNFAANFVATRRVVVTPRIVLEEEKNLFPFLACLLQKFIVASNSL